MTKIFKNIFSFYFDGFKSMSKVGIKLWIIIIIKIIILFAVLKLFFFQDYLDSRFDTPQEKSEHVFEQITNVGE